VGDGSQRRGTGGGGGGGNVLGLGFSARPSTSATGGQPGFTANDGNTMDALAGSIGLIAFP